MTRSRPGWVRYALAFASVAAAWGLGRATWPLFEPTPFMPFYAAVMVTAWYGGLAPAVIATLLSALTVQGFFVWPFGELKPADMPTALRLGGFVTVCVFISILTEELRRSRFRSEANERALQAERGTLQQTLAELQSERVQLAEANDALQVQSEELSAQAEELEVQATEFRAQSDELRRIERELRQQVSFTGALAECLDEGLCALDREGNFTFLNPAAERILGWPREALIGRHMHHSVHYQRPDGTAYPLAECPMHHVRETGRAVRVDDEVFMRRDGTPVPVAYSSAPLWQGGELTGAVVAFADIRQRRDAEAERTRLLEAERHARAEAERERERASRILDIVEDGFYFFDRDFRYVAVNRRGAEIARLPASELVGRTVLDLYPDALELPWFQAARRTMQERTPARVENHVPGLGIWVESHLYPTEQGFVSVSRDISDRKRAELALRESEERLRLALEAGQMGTWDWDPNAPRLVWSRTMETMFGLTPGGFDGTFEGFLRCVHPEDREKVAAAITESGERGGRHHVVHRIVRPDGSVRWIEGIGRAAMDEGGRLARMVGVAFDVTDRVEAAETIRNLNQDLERRVRERTKELEQSVQELDAFSYSISHDLRGPLRAMRGFADAILEDLETRMETNPRDYARRIAAAATHMDRLIQDLLAYSRLSRAMFLPEPVDLTDVFDEVRIAMADELERRGAQLEADLASVPRVLGHRTTLFQVLTNLIGNAVKFVEPGTVPRVRVGHEEHDGRVRVWVEDNGIGIEPEHREKIFGVFERLHPVDRYPGTGVGLAIVRKAITRMGGDTDVTSEPGQGSRFWFELPIAPRDPQNN